MWRKLSKILALAACLGSIGASCLCGAATRHYVFTEDFEGTIDPVQDWASNGDYTVAFKGLVADKARSGKKSFKLDMTFGSATYVYWQVPVPQVPAEGTLRFQGHIMVDSESDINGSLGANVVMPPTSGSGCIFLSNSSAKDEWRNVRGDLVEPCKETAELVMRDMSWGVTARDIGVCVDKIGIFIYGSRGKRIVLYVDDLKIEGDVPTDEDYAKQVQLRWSPYSKKRAERVKSWDKSLVRAQAKLDRLTGLSPRAMTIKQQAIGEARSLATKVAALKTAQLIPSDTARAVDSYLQRVPRVVQDIRNLKDDRVEASNFQLMATPPVTDLRILPDALPVSLSTFDRISLSGVPGQYLPASVVVHALSDINRLTVEAGTLDGPKGAILPSSVDVSVVKCWYQSGEGTPFDNKRILTPELLLKDDSLVKVDDATKDNFLKLSYPDAEKYVCISEGRSPVDVPYIEGAAVVPIEKCPVKDSSSLLPISMRKDTNKQFWLTLKIPGSIPAGDYTGYVKVTADGVAARLKLSVKVLPFKLASPRTHYDLKKPFVSSLYHRAILNPDGTNSMSSELKSEEQYKLEIEDMVAHGVTNPVVYQRPDGPLFAKVLDIRKAAGVDTSTLYYLGVSTGAPEDQPSLDRLRSAVKEVIEAAKASGISDVYFYGIDEATGDVMARQRRAWEVVHEAGGKVFTAGQSGINVKALGDVQDLLVCAYAPVSGEADLWHARNHKIWCYSNPQGGIEVPESYRRNYGLLLWKSDYDGACTYAYQHGFNSIWDDFDSVQYRDHVFAYPTVDGLIGTVQWEGYRSAIDDIRYATTLMLQIEKARNGKDARMKKVALDAEKYITNVDVYGDLDAIRSRIVHYILKLTTRSSKEKARR